jgi:Tfp pilus assembly protein PilO
MAQQLAQNRNIDSILKTSQQKAISTGILTFTLVAALLWGSFRPTVITIIETNNKFKEKTQALEKFETQNSNLTTLLTKRLELQPELKSLDYFFPHDGDYSLFVTNLNQIAKNYGLTLDSVIFSDTYFRQVEKVTALQFEAMTPVTFQASLSGDVSKVAQFLSYVESIPFLPKVIGVGYSPNRADPAKTNVSTTFLMYKTSAKAAANE